MEDVQPKTGQFALKYGAILGAISVAFSFMLYTVDMHYQQDWKVGIINIVVMIVVIAIGITQFKKANSGFLKLGQALKVGVGTSLVSAIIGTIFGQILTNVIDPETMNKAIEFQKGQLAERGMNPQEIEAAMQMGEIFQNPAIQIATGIVGALFLGFIISLIVGLITKKDQPAY